MAIKYFYTSKGSAAELYTQLVIAHEIGYLNKSILDDLIEECEAISSMLYRLIAARSEERQTGTTKD